VQLTQADANDLRYGGWSRFGAAGDDAAELSAASALLPKIVGALKPLPK